MEKSGSLARVSRGRQSGKGMKVQQARYVIPDIPSNVKVSEFEWDAPVDLEAILKLSVSLAPENQKRRS
jgi:hypothetical protein